MPSLVADHGELAEVVITVVNAGGVDLSALDVALGEGAPDWVSLESALPNVLGPGEVGTVSLSAVMDKSLSAEPFELVVTALGQPVAASGCALGKTSEETLTVSVTVDAYTENPCDRDLDGFESAECSGGNDCDDEDGAINPAAEELCDGIDNDCNGLVDDDAVDGSIWHLDEDEDGFGSANEALSSCDMPAGYVEDDTDCDDAAAEINPDAEEVCDGIDNDCDALVDDSDPDVVLLNWFGDTDGDGYGEGVDVVQACFAPSGYVETGDDCDDDDPGSYPGAVEFCDGVDQDCDTVVDNDTVDDPTWYVDDDGDGFGFDPIVVCAQPSGTSDIGSDCDDSDPLVNPAADEICNRVDDDCNGLVDDEAPGLATFFEDEDGDGFGSSETTIEACFAPTGYLEDDTDCDDDEVSVNPEAPEICDSLDNDCNGLVDDAPVDEPTWYDSDSDGDGWGDPDSVISVGCGLPPGAYPGPDCEPLDPTIHPEADELCDGIDQDCDAVIDNDVIDGSVAFGDEDGDGFGSADLAEGFCGLLPSGFVLDDTDCDDSAATTFPGAAEICDLADNNCDGVVDEAGASGELPWFADVDGDGFGDPGVQVLTCEQPDGFVADDTDCDDLQPTSFPGAVEICDQLDNDCNGVVDDGAVVDALWMFDGDRDGFGDPDVVQASCASPGPEWVLGIPDCDDASFDVNPLAVEICDGIDNDCDGDIDSDAEDIGTFWLDADGDGFGDANERLDTCDPPTNFVADDTDCDDDESSVFPGNTEVCNGQDDDCDDLTDEAGAEGEVSWFMDADDDGFGDTADVLFACDPLPGRLLDDTDCDDAEAAVFPGGTEVCDDLDNDCNGLVDDGALDAVTWRFDGDSDGFGDPATAVIQCASPGVDFVEGGEDDCNDAEATVFPGNPEVCDTLDNDCDGVVDNGASDAATWFGDGDGDGFGEASNAVEACTAPSGFVADDTDCDDADATAFPGAIESCDGDDEDCDGEIDESGAVGERSWFADSDGDGFGDPAAELLACDLPSGFVGDSTDCNDAEITVFPGGVEVCDGLDNDCNLQIDDLPSDGEIWMQDGDGDGFGFLDSAFIACEAPGPDWVTGLPDCDDSEPTVFPGGVEVCDTLDNDCDGVVDVGVVDGQTYFIDTDDDGFGDPLDTLEACETPDGYSDNADDCDDADGTAFPGADEVCDGDDEDCDGLIDEGGALDETTWFADTDGDDFGDSASPLSACAQPPGHVADDTDCDDNEPTVFPGGVEVCDGLDNDCNTLIDDAIVDGISWMFDDDGDGFGDPAITVVACESPGSGFVTGEPDCDDAAVTVFPGAVEVCDGLDNNCDGDIDLGAVDGDPFFADTDGDGFGDPDVTLLACSIPAGFVADDTDCDDQDGTAFPGAVEVCDGDDENCDGVIDESGAIGGLDWHLDGDGDGFGDPNDVLIACTGPGDRVLDDTDCDDGEATVNPGADETCNGRDDDCDTEIDEDPVDGTFWFADDDSDTFGDPLDSVLSCDPIPNRVEDSSDCDDGNGAINPSATEICDGVDNNCDGQIDVGAAGGSTWFGDGDGDGFGDDADVVDACTQPPGFEAVGGDCDDGDSSVFPGAPEFCDGRDTDCNGILDDDTAEDALDWYPDTDGDGFGDPDGQVTACEAPPGFIGDDSDCDDTSNQVFPGAIEICDGVDNNCDGAVDDLQTWYQDNDGDGHGNIAVPTLACVAPPGFVALDDDCNDGNSAVFPGAPEICDFFDNDCDGEIDNGALDQRTYYEDLDGDGFGVNPGQEACQAPPGWVELVGDCDDSNNVMNPGAAEVCDAFDNDCDTLIDNGNVCVCPVEYYSGHAYMFCGLASQPYATAILECSSQNYQPVVINNQQENDFLTDTAVLYNPEDWWIGLNDQSIEGFFEWVDGTPLLFEAWEPGEPNNFFGEDCVEFDTDFGEWNDTDCGSTSNNIICESP